MANRLLGCGALLSGAIACGLMAGCLDGSGGSSGGAASDPNAQSTSAAANAPVSGAIFTTDSTCTQVNGNIYDAKTDVYLDGGPAKSGAAGLPDGTYYYEITDPGCKTLLAGPDATGTTPNTVTKTITVVGGEFTSCLQLAPFDTTPNNGGEYKVTVTLVSNYDPSAKNSCFGFVASESKTDNFKVKADVTPPPECAPSTVSGVVFDDASGDCVREIGEVTFDATVLLTTPSGATLSFKTTDGTFTFGDLLPGDYSLTLDPTSFFTCTTPCTVTFTVGCAQDLAFEVGGQPATPLAVQCPSPQSIVIGDCQSGPPPVFFDVSATGGCGAVKIVTDHQSGDLFPPGTTTVHVTATDANGNTDTCSFDVVISN